MGFTILDVQHAIGNINQLLGISPQPNDLSDFEHGRARDLLSYDKLQPPSRRISALERYLIAATSFTHQPVVYYDIFRACRAAIIVQLLATAVNHLRNAQTPFLESRLERLTKEDSYDSFDAIFFELVTAWRYSEYVPNANVSFIEENPLHRTPDFSYEWFGVPSSCECKKLDRSDSHTIRMRNAARECLNPVLTALRRRGISASSEVIFHVEPSLVSSATIYTAVRDSLRSATAIIEPTFTILSNPLSPYISSSLQLYPSPGYFWDRYGYRHRSEWMGIVDQLAGNFVQPDGSPLNEEVPASTWMEEVFWEAAFKWRIDSEPLLARYRRFAFDNIFKGFTQVKDFGFNSAVHLWLESDYYLQGRESSLNDLLARLRSSPQHPFGWLIINESLFDVSPKGYFDIIEHAHYVGGPYALDTEPPVTGVLTGGTMIPSPSGEFGRGVSLPDIDV